MTDSTQQAAQEPEGKGGEGFDETVEAKSMLQIVISQFRDHRLAVVGFVFICFFLFVGIFADLISLAINIDPDEQNLTERYAPMGSTLERSYDQREYELEQFAKRNADAMPALLAELSGAGILNAGADNEAFISHFAGRSVAALPELRPLTSEAAGDLSSAIEEFMTFHLLGTDEAGRDVLLRLVYGTRISIFVGIIVALAAAIIGLFIGSLAGYYGGIMDAMLMRVTDSLIALPRLPFMIVFAAVDLKQLPLLDLIISGENESIWKVFVVLVIFSWMTVARLVRGSILSIREREFVLAARTLGARDIWIIFRHITPNVIAPLLVAVTLGVGESILSEAALSFLSLGIQPPTPSWGNMLLNAKEMIYEAPHLILLPGVLILITVMSFNFFGDGLQDAIDPKAIRR